MINTIADNASKAQQSDGGMELIMDVFSFAPDKGMLRVAGIKLMRAVSFFGSPEAGEGTIGIFAETGDDDIVVDGVRLGSLLGTVSRGSSLEGTVLPEGGGGNVMRAFSFFGSFGSAIRRE